MQPACLPEDSFQHHMEPHRNAYSVGFGTASRMFFRRFSLSNALINIMHHSFCHNVDIHRPKDWSKQFCAGEFDEFNNKTNYCMGSNFKPLFHLSRFLKSFSFSKLRRHWLSFIHASYGQRQVQVCGRWYFELSRGLCNSACTSVSLTHFDSSSRFKLNQYFIFKKGFHEYCCLQRLDQAK